MKQVLVVLAALVVLFGCAEKKGKFTHLTAKEEAQSLIAGQKVCGPNWRFDWVVECDHLGIPPSAVTDIEYARASPHTTDDCRVWATGRYVRLGVPYKYTCTFDPKTDRVALYSREERH